MRGLLHGGEARACQLVGVNDHVYAMGGKLFLGHDAVRRGHNDQRGFGIIGSEEVAELQHFGGARAAAMDHDAVCACLNVGARTLERIVHTLAQDKALDARDNHEAVA